MSVELRIVKTGTQHRRYLAEIGRLMDRDPDPVETIRSRMEEQGLRQKDIAPLLGGKSRASEILSRKRPLTVPMIRALIEHLHIPAELLVRES